MELARADVEGSRVDRRRWMHRLTLGTLVLLLVGAVLDGMGAVDLVGPDEAVVRAEGGGFELEVQYAEVSRPALATIFRLRVRRPGGFDEPVQLGVTRAYLESFDLNGVIPGPASETSLGEWIVWEFDPPPGDELVVTYEARIEPAIQEARPGRAAVFVDDEPVAEVEFSTRVMP